MMVSNVKSTIESNYFGRYSKILSRFEWQKRKKFVGAKKSLTLTWP